MYIKTPNSVKNFAQNVMAIEAKLILAQGDQKIDILLDAPNLQKNKVSQVAQQARALL